VKEIIFAQPLLVAVAIIFEVVVLHLVSLLIIGLTSALIGEFKNVF
jgi:hypothetical protein